MAPPPCLKAAKEVEANEDDVSTQDTDPITSPTSESMRKAAQVRRVHWDPSLPEDDSRVENGCSKSYHKRRVAGALNLLWEGKTGREDWEKTIVELRSLRVHDGQFEGPEGPLAEELRVLAVSACTVARAKDEWSQLFCCPAPRDNSGAYEGC